MRRHRKSEGFSLAFLDIMSCGLGAVVLVFMLVKHNAGSSTVQSDLLKADVQILEIRELELQKTLAKLEDISTSEADKIAELRASLARLNKSLSQKELSLAQKKETLAALKNDISTRPVAKKADLVEDDRGGEENYLIGLKVEGRRIALLIDSSGSMTDETLLAIIKRKNLSAGDKQGGSKWQRTKKTVRWLLARVPKSSRLTVLSFNGSVKSLTKSNWPKADNPAIISDLYRQLDKIVPTGGTNLQRGLQAVSRARGVTDLYLITDGLPTIGDSRYAGLNPFARCSSLLGRSKTISGECRVKLFRKTVADSDLRGVKVNVILLPLEGDPDAVNEYWGWAAKSGGLVISPAANWP